MKIYFNSLFNFMGVLHDEVGAAGLYNVFVIDISEIDII